MRYRKHGCSDRAQAWRRRLPGLRSRWSLALVCLVLVACGAQASTSSPPAPGQNAGGLEVAQVEIWAARDPQEAAAIALADELGYYREEGLVVTIKWITSGADVPSLAAGGQVNFFAESGYITAMVKEKGVDIRYVMPLADISGTQGFLLGPRVSLSSPKDLEGKKVGMAKGAGISIAIANMAKAHGVDFGKITFVDLQPSDQLAALTSGSVDAIAVWQPWSLNARKAGGKLYFTGNRSFVDGKETPVTWMYLDSGLNVKGDFMDRNPNTVKAVMRALKRATDYINATAPDKVAETLSRPLQIDRADLEVMIKENTYSNEINDRVISGLTELLNWANSLGYIARPATPKDVYDLDFLKELSPGSVKAQGF